MNIGFIGLGKLGLPCALAIESKGHNVIGYDVNQEVKNYVKNKNIPYREINANEFLQKSNIKFLPLDEVVSKSEIIFVAIQTPHKEKYEGITRIPNERKDFNYSYLREGISYLSQEINAQGKEKIVIVISTVLPGTIEREIIPVTNKFVRLCYNPFFIAMGTTIPNFLNPEFVLFGVNDEIAANKAEEFYKTIHNNVPFCRMSIKSAELTKVAYNTFIGMKIIFVNTLMEICYNTGANVDEVTSALKLATDRLISTKYMNAGVGDGGHCHPRDNIALSWLARKLDLSYDIFEKVMLSREAQAEWFAKLIQEQWKLNPSPVYILGTAYKVETNLTGGSFAILLKNIIEEKGLYVTTYDPYVNTKKPEFKQGIYFIGMNHPEFKTYTYPEGSVILDPWGYMPKFSNVKVINIGR